MSRVDFGNNRGENLADPKYDKDAVNLRTHRRSIKKLNSEYLPLSGGSMTGRLNMISGSTFASDGGELILSGGTLRSIGGGIILSGGNVTLTNGDVYLSAGTGNIITPYIPHTAGPGNYVAVHTPNVSPGGGGLLASSATLLSACINPSDINLKKNIKKVESVDSILKIESVFFEWKDNEGQVNTGVNLGVIAQQVQEHIPHAVWSNANDVLHIDNLALTSALISKVKEQDKTIKDLESRMKSIEKKLGI